MVLALPTYSVESFPETSELFCNTLLSPLRCKPPLDCNSAASGPRQTQQQHNLQEILV